MDLTLYKPNELELWISNKYQRNGIYYASDMDVEHIASIFNIIVSFYDGKCKAEWEDGDYAIILINAYLKIEQKRERFFHELCHPLKHAGDQDRLPKLFKQLQEAQAAQFQLYAAMPIYMIKEYIYEVSTYSALELLLAKEFTLPIPFVRKRIEQIQNRIYWEKRDKEWRERDTDTSFITPEYIRNLQEELGRQRRERLGLGG